MKLFSLDKKLLTVQHKFTKSELFALVDKHQLTQEQLQQELQKELYQKFMLGIARNIPTIVNGDEETTTYTVRGYILNDRDMLNVLKECLEMDEKGKEMLIKDINKQLGIFTE